MCPEKRLGFAPRRRGGYSLPLRRFHRRLRNCITPDALAGSPRTRSQTCGHDIISDGARLTSTVQRSASRPSEMTDTSTRGVRMSDATTRGIRVQVRSEFIPDRSSPREGSYLFQYHVRISNSGPDAAQLISREWIITNADGEVERVKGQGVVGEQPVLPPGGSFEYTSFCPLKTAVGAMQGNYQMVTTDGERFDAVIAPFTLAVPNALN